MLYGACLVRMDQKSHSFLLNFLNLWQQGGKLPVHRVLVRHLRQEVMASRLSNQSQGSVKLSPLLKRRARVQHWAGTKSCQDAVHACSVVHHRRYKPRLASARGNLSLRCICPARHSLQLFRSLLLLYPFESDLHHDPSTRQQCIIVLCHHQWAARVLHLPM